MVKTEEYLKQAEEQINNEQRTVDYDTREFTIEIIVSKYEKNEEINQNEIYVPDYQREFVWDSERQSKFIESVVLGLPIPLIFVAENKEDGRLEIVDGSQRIRTLHAFIKNHLELTHLEKLPLLNGIKFKDLSIARQRKINNTPMRMIVLSENATEEVKNDMFERINRGSDLLKDMEKRKGIYKGPFNNFIYKVCAVNPLFKKLAPMNKYLEKRQEHEELVLRFFYLVDNYPSYPKYVGIAKSLDEYIENKNKTFNDFEMNQKLMDFEQMINFVDRYFQYGFAKSPNPQVSRVFFEAIAVGSFLALKEKSELSARKVDIDEWIANPEFHEATFGKYQTHTPNKILQRINFVKNKLVNM